MYLWNVLQEAAAAFPNFAMSSGDIRAHTASHSVDLITSLTGDLHGVLRGIADGPLRDWCGDLMFTTEGDYYRRMSNSTASTSAGRRVVSPDERMK